MASRRGCGSKREPAQLRQLGIPWLLARGPQRYVGRNRVTPSRALSIESFDGDGVTERERERACLGDADFRFTCQRHGRVFDQRRIGWLAVGELYYPLCAVDGDQRLRTRPPSVPPGAISRFGARVLARSRGLRTSSCNATAQQSQLADQDRSSRLRDEPHIKLVTRYIDGVVTHRAPAFD